MSASVRSNEKTVSFLEKAIRCFETNSYGDFENNCREFELFHANEKSDWSAYLYDFLDSWCDAWHHDWQYHDPLEKNDWVVIAKQLVTLQSENTKFEAIDFKGKRFSSF